MCLIILHMSGLLNSTTQMAAQLWVWNWPSKRHFGSDIKYKGSKTAFLYGENEGFVFLG